MCVYIVFMFVHQSLSTSQKVTRSISVSLDCDFAEQFCTLLHCRRSWTPTNSNTRTSIIDLQHRYFAIVAYHDVSP